jgi:hypothetical protein
MLGVKKVEAFPWNVGLFGAAKNSPGERSEVGRFGTASTMNDGSTAKNPTQTFIEQGLRYFFARHIGKSPWFP